MNNITDLSPDTNNYNKGTETGDRLLEKSISKFGFRQPAVIDKNGNIVAGNKRIAKAGELGIEEIQVVKGDPQKITVIQYDDFDLVNDEKTKEYALADNQVAKINILIDNDLVIDDLGEDIAEEWLVEEIEIIENSDGSSNQLKDQVFRVYVDTKNEQEQNEVWTKISELGLDPKLATI